MNKFNDLLIKSIKWFKERSWVFPNLIKQALLRGPTPAPQQGKRLHSLLRRHQFHREQLPLHLSLYLLQLSSSQMPL